MSDAPDSGLANTPVRPSLLAPHRSPMPIPRPIAPMAIPSRDRPAAEDAVSTHPAAPAVDLADLGDALLAADIARLATGYDVPAEMPLLSVLVTSATALGSLIRVGLGAVRSEPPVLWGAIVATPGARKSDMTALPKMLLEAATVAERERWRQDHEAAQRDKSRIELEWRIYQAEQRKALIRDLPDPRPPARSPDSVVVPIRPGIVIQDSSVEDMTEMLAGSPRGVLALADEAATLLGQGRQMRSRLLQSTGGSALRVGRISRESRELQSLAVSILTGTQPDKITGLVGRQDDGLAGRFFWVWIDEERDALIARTALSLDGLIELVGRLRAMGRVEDVTTIPIEEAGLDRLKRAMRDWSEAGRRAGGLVRSWYAKAGGHCGRLALVLEAIAAARDGDALPRSVSLARIEAAIALVDRLFAPGMIRVARHVAQDPGEQIRENLVRHLMASGTQRFRARELRRSRTGLFGSPAAFEDVLKELESEDVLSRADRQPGAQGRSPGDYVVNRAKLAAALAG